MLFIIIDKVKKSISKIIKKLDDCAYAVLIIVTITEIVGMFLLGSIYLTKASGINSSESFFEALSIIAGIIIPLIFLILIDLIKNPSLKCILYNKLILAVISSLILLSLYFVLGAISINTFTQNISQAIYLMYGSVVLDAVILTFLLYLHLQIYLVPCHNEQS
jgi:hypothetical protein